MAGTAKAVFQPDLSINIQYKDGATCVAKVITIEEAFQAAKPLGYNTIVLSPTYWNYDCYTSIIAFNLPQLNELHLANSDLFTDGLLASAYLERFTGFNSTSFGNIYYQNNSWYVRNTGPITNVFSGTSTHSGINYGQRQISDNTNYPIYFYTEANVGTLYINNIPQIDAIVASGGGATHIAKVTGLLSTLSSNLSDILMVSGGGGGGMLSGDTEYEGAEAGGISGSGTLSGNQSTGYGFGQGEAGLHTSAGGGGLYGGYKGTSSLGGGAGSGYVGNDLVSEKKMVGYNVPTSDAESTKTESTMLYSEGIMSDAAKMGNGGAKVTLIEELPQELVLYNNGQVNSKYFDVNGTIGTTQAEPISKNFEVKSNHLLFEYNNWQSTIQWRGILVTFDGKDFPPCYTKVKFDVEIYAKYNSSNAAIELRVNDNQTGVKNFNGGVGVRKVSDTRYQIAGQSSFEATSRYETDEMELLLSNTNHLVIEFNGVNQYHEGYAKIYKITLSM